MLYLPLPHTPSQVVWDIFVAILIVYGCLNIPLRIGFDLPTSLGQIITDSFIDIVFLSDIILSFRTVYLAPDGEPVTSPGDIAIRYLKGAFLIDVCSTIPVDLLMLLLGGTSGILRSTKLLRTLRLLRLARLLKLSKIGGKEDDLKNVLNPSLWALIKMLVSLIFIAHIMGCMWNWLLILRFASGRSLQEGGRESFRRLGGRREGRREGGRQAGSQKGGGGCTEFGLYTRRHCIFG